MKTRNGKIARLPLEIREQLNARLSDGEPGNCLVEWLNSIPDVIKVMAEQFDGRPINENNISEWRQGGYEEWLTLSSFLDETHILSPAVAGPARFPTPAYAPSTSTWCSSPITRTFCRTLRSCLRPL